MVKISVNRSDLTRILAAIDRVAAVVNAYSKSIPEESAREYTDTIKSNITTQKYGDFGKPHKKWKKGSANESMYWLWLGTVLKSITPSQLNSPAGFIRWFVGIKSTGTGLANPSSGTTATANKRIIVKPKLNPQQQRTKSMLKEQAEARKAASTGVKVFSKEEIAAYRPQSGKKTGTMLAGAKTLTLGHQVIQRKIISDTSWN
jgi:hypothetical protein